MGAATACGMFARLMDRTAPSASSQIAVHSRARSTAIMSLPDRQNRIPRHTHAAAGVVLANDLPFRHGAARRQRQGATTRAWRTLQNRLSHGPANPNADGEGCRLRNDARHVEIDEAYMGGDRKGFGLGQAGKQIVMGSSSAAAARSTSLSRT